MFLILFIVFDLILQKFFAFFALALVAAVSADVSHLRQYLPPVESAPAPAPIQYSAPVAAPAPAPVHYSAPVEQPAAATFNEQDGYNYQAPF